eukprot:CAMPEP_0204620882 /NCGR_PEP_ID=MMETSP0717-20131115/6780_1 /ASSEMBLY_ACC=CAM_ASM_000666 /TAXON_ID=230516 /ORGANISM="Chaetoceros curvisetus" /LENGTH=130 /DNA_ID=CAMNT_0051635173 /DNA_START=163 /DNA_END=556 /DNA_ORIENTATION=-
MGYESIIAEHPLAIPLIILEDKSSDRILRSIVVTNFACLGAVRLNISLTELLRIFGKTFACFGLIAEDLERGAVQSSACDGIELGVAVSISDGFELGVELPIFDGSEVGTAVSVDDGIGLGSAEGTDVGE